MSGVYFVFKRMNDKIIQKETFPRKEDKTLEYRKYAMGVYYVFKK